GQGSAVWKFDAGTKTVSAQPVSVARMSEEDAEVVSGLSPGDRIVSLGAHLLKAGETVRQAPPSLTGVAR
ncbi:efflux RND transporter periplasmic adaptor subunit, partial [Myxococcus xanthus]|nr:efflux RND transporter periplasmic adaptor subunit [Myxococcus xanthus]